jgi:hypothetical protein
MKEIKTAAAQGDVIIRKVKALPSGTKETPRNGSIVVSHSETGHHHVVRDEGVRCFEIETPTSPEQSLVCYLQMGDSCSFDLEHLRDYDTHETLRFKGKPGDVFEVRRQREHTPEGWRRVQD